MVYGKYPSSIKHKHFSATLKNMLTAVCWRWGFEIWQDKGFLAICKGWKTFKTALFCPETVSVRTTRSSCITHLKSLQKSQVLNSCKTSHLTFILSKKLIAFVDLSPMHSEVILSCVCMFALQNCYIGEWKPSDIQCHQIWHWHVHVCCP